MANRLTKGKALVGALDVQGALTVNGAPVGGGAEAIIYTQDITNPYDPSVSMFYRTIYWQNINGATTRGDMYVPGRVYNSTTMQYDDVPFFADNNLQDGDVFDMITLTYVDQSYAEPFRNWTNFYSFPYAYSQASVFYDMMINGPALRLVINLIGIGQEFNPMTVSSLTLKKR